MKKGGSAALAAMLRQRTEVIQSGGTPAPPAQLVALQPPQPLSEGDRLPKQTHPAAFAVQEAVSQQRPAPPAPRAISPTPAARALSPARATNNDGPMLISHPKRNFSPTPARNASPTPVAAGRTLSPTPAAPPRSISPLHSTASPTNANIAGLPKTIPFSGANKCFVCDKTVYKMEEIIAVGHVWHDKCFTCGGKSLRDSGCGRVLKRDGYLDHAGEPFCQACYNKLYRPKGFNVGVGMNTDVSSNNNNNTANTAVAPAVSPVNKPVPPPPAPPAAPPAPPAARPAPPAPTPAPVSTTPALGGGSKCSICTKTVYKMEEIIALGRIFHDKCFTCGGVNNDGCGKVLKRDTYVDHDNEPYCQPCYARLFGPKTFGFGLTGESTVPNGSGNNVPVAPPAKPVPAPPAVKPAPPPPLAPGMSSTTGKPTVSIGTTSKADQSGLFKEASYVGDNDEVDESEW